MRTLPLSESCAHALVMPDLVGQGETVRILHHQCAFDAFDIGATRTSRIATFIFANRRQAYAAVALGLVTTLTGAG